MDKKKNSFISKVLVDAIEKDKKENIARSEVDNVNDAFNHLNQSFSNFIKASSFNKSTDIKDGLSNSISSNNIQQSNIQLSMNDKKDIDCKEYDKIANSIKSYLVKCNEDKNNNIVSNNTYNNLPLKNATNNMQFSVLNNLLHKEQDFNANNTIQLSNDLPITQADTNLDALDAIYIASSVSETESIKRNLEYYTPDFVGGNTSFNTYCTLTDLADGRTRSDLFGKRSISIEIEDENYQQTNLNQINHNSIDNMLELSFQSKKNRKVRQLLPIFNMGNSARGQMNESDFADSITGNLYNTDDKSANSTNMSSANNTGSSLQQLLTNSVALARDCILQQSFLTSNSLNRTHCTKKTISKEIASVEDDEIQVITINDIETLPVVSYPDKKSLPKCIDTLLKLGIVNGVCQLKDIKPSTADNQNVWCFGVVENGEYHLENRALNDIYLDETLRLNYVNTMISLATTTRTDFDIGTSGKAFGKVELLLDYQQAIYLNNFIANNISPLNNYTYAYNKNGSETIQNMITHVNSLLTSDTMQYHNVSFLPEQPERQQKWGERGMLHPEFNAMLEKYFPKNKKNTLFSFYFKDTFRYYFTDIISKVYNEYDNILVRSLYCFTPVVNVFNIFNKTNNNLPFCFHTFSEDL